MNVKPLSSSNSSLKDIELSSPTQPLRMCTLSPRATFLTTPPHAPSLFPRMARRFSPRVFGYVVFKSQMASCKNIGTDLVHDLLRSPERSLSTLATSLFPLSALSLLTTPTSPPYLTSNLTASVCSLSSPRQTPVPPFNAKVNSATVEVKEDVKARQVLEPGPPSSSLVTTPSYNHPSKLSFLQGVLYPMPGLFRLQLVTLLGVGRIASSGVGTAHQTSLGFA